MYEQSKFKLYNRRKVKQIVDIVRSQLEYESIDSGKLWGILHVIGDDLLPELKQVYSASMKSYHF